MVQLGFNTQEYDIPTFGDPIKPGWYAARVHKADLKATKDGQGQYLEIEFAIDENHHPDLAGRLVWDRLNVFHRTEKTMRIARGQLRKLQESCGKPMVQDTDELLGSAVLVKVKVRAETAEYRAQNEIDDYKPGFGCRTSCPVTSSPAMAAAGSSAPAAQPQAAAATPAQVPAWMRK